MDGLFLKLDLQDGADEDDRQFQENEAESEQKVA